MTRADEIRGFHYELSWEQVEAHLALSPADRLRWLQAANEFLWKFTPPEQRRIWESLRDGTNEF